MVLHPSASRGSNLKVTGRVPSPQRRPVRSLAATVLRYVWLVVGGLGDEPAKASIDRQGLVQQFEAAIDGLEEALRDCPDELWEASMWHVPRTDPWVWPKPGTDPVRERTDESIQRFSAFWVVAYHCLWFLEFYLSADPSGFESPEFVRGGPRRWAGPRMVPLRCPTASSQRDALSAYADHGRRCMR